MGETTIAWDSTYDEGWARQVANWTWQRKGDVYRLEGECPNCEHPMSHEFEHATILLRLVTVSPPEEESVWVMVKCNCEEAHAGRPRKVTSGCGKSVRLQVPVS